MSDEAKQWWQTLPAIIGGLAALVTALTGLLVALNQSGVFKQTEKKPAPAEEPVTAITAAKPVKSAEGTKPSTPALSPMATVAEKRAETMNLQLRTTKAESRKRRRATSLAPLRIMTMPLS
jgi:hypothetical protein